MRWPCSSSATCSPTCTHSPTARRAARRGRPPRPSTRRLPDLELLNLKSHAANQLSVATGFVLRSAGYGLVYAAAVLLLAMAIFSRRDLN